VLNGVILEIRQSHPPAQVEISEQNYRIFQHQQKELLFGTNANFFLFREVGYLHSVFVSICQTTANHYILRACAMD
jgi:hypothetical protein